MNNPKEHWENVYQTKKTDQVSLGGEMLRALKKPYNRKIKTLQ